MSIKGDARYGFSVGDKSAYAREEAKAQAQAKRICKPRRAIVTSQLELEPNLASQIQ